MAKLTPEQERIKKALIAGTNNDSPTVVIHVGQLLKVYSVADLVKVGLIQSEDTEVVSIKETPLRRHGRISRGGVAVSEKESALLEVDRELLRELLGV